MADIIHALHFELADRTRRGLGPIDNHEGPDCAIIISLTVDTVSKGENHVIREGLNLGILTLSRCFVLYFSHRDNRAEQTSAYTRRSVPATLKGRT